MTKFLRTLLAIALLAAAGSAQAQVSLPGTDWTGSATVSATIKAKGQDAERVSGPVTYTLYLGPLPAEGLAASQFRIELDDGTGELEFDGTYTESGRKLIFTPNQAGFESELRDLIEEVCLAEFDPVTCSVFDSLTLQVTKSSFKQKLRSSGTSSIASKGSISFRFLSGTETLMKVKLSFKAADSGLQ